MIKSTVENRLRKIVIAGAGPAGSSLAIRLALRGFDVTLIERERFPRHKLCGEFISPECISHFEMLGVRAEILAKGGQHITKTTFYECGGRSVTIPSTWFGNGETALSLSRALMDLALLERARDVGVSVKELTGVSALAEDHGKIIGLRTRSVDGIRGELGGDLFIDATGRAAVLSRLASRRRGLNTTPIRRKHGLVAFKAHFENAGVLQSCCEIYGFPGGYGGLCRIENGLSNLCFFVKAEIVRRHNGDAESLLYEVVFRNDRAQTALKQAKATNDWLAVSVDSFGTKDLCPAPNVFAVGDSAAFIDPFTGSGMLMALESSELLADLIALYAADPVSLAAAYLSEFRRRFGGRLRVCSLVRRAAMSPYASKFLVSLLGASSSARFLLTRSTRGRTGAEGGQKLPSF